MNKITFSIFSAAFFLITAFSPQVEFPARLQQQLSIYYRYHASLKLFVTFSQPKYSAGDTAFFNVYVLSATGKPQTSGKQVVNVMLVNAQQQSVLHNKTFVQNGSGFSQLIIPTTLPGGSYTLLAATDNGTSNKTAAYFQRSFVITEEKSLVDDRTTPAVQFFAEGGNLVEGLASTVVVSGISGTGEAHVTDHEGNRVTSLNVLPNGIARFFFTPAAAKQYTLEYRGARVPVSAAKPDGVVMAVSEKGSGGMEASLEVRSDSPLRDAELYLIMNVHDQICAAMPVSFKKNTRLSLTLSNKLCTSGVAQLTLFTASGQALAERILFFAPPKPRVEVVPDKKDYRTREKVEVLIRLAPSSEQGIHTGNASMTVYKKDFFNDVMPASFFSHVFFNDLAIPPGISLDGNYTAEEINDALIACRWKKFTWNDIFHLQPAEVTSSNPVFFKGRVTDNQNNAVKDSTMITFWLNQNDFIYGVYTRKNGEFVFPLFKNFTDDHVVYAVTHKGRLLENARVTVNEPTHTVEDSVAQTSGQAYDTYHAFTKVKIPVLRSFGYYERKSRDSLRINSVGELPDYIETDFTIDLRKYKPFASVAEILGEVVPMVKTKKVQGRDDIRVFIKGNSMFASGSPLLVIDGVLTDSVGYLMAMDASTILSMGVIHDKNELVRYGVLGKNGILVVSTSAPLLHQEALIGKGTLNVKGIDIPIAFIAKKYHEPSNKRIPDLRSTLHWQPDVKVNSTDNTPVQFYTADGTGTYVIKVTGLTQAGIPFEEFRYFNVNR